LGTGVLLAKVARIACENSLTGLEFASGIPGTIGGAIRMNAGAYGSEMKDIVAYSKYIEKNTGKICEINNKEHGFEYRNSRFESGDEIILSTKLQLQKGNQEEIKEKMKKYMKSRKDSQPLNYANAGSTFKRNKNFITAKVIDECGLKGYNVGDAFVSEKHAGFIVNKGVAKAKDVLELIEHVKNKVYERMRRNNRARD
jgi:UDP-N-acetylmuramate dehydrogenase